jgi:hypothetical protein
MALIPDAALRRLIALPGFPSLWTRFPYGSVATRVRYGIFERPHYAYGTYQAALQAKALKIPAISVMEFGVSRGFGLLALEATAREVGEATGIKISVFGFDSGKGMPPPEDYRDLPHIWQAGFYKMDVPKLKARLQGAELMLGDVGDTVQQWLKRTDVPPLGFAAFDLDYYSSTKRAFQLFKGPATHHLPRTYCYLDDIALPENACNCEFIGELAAVRDFNAEQEDRKIAPLHLLRNMRPAQAYWHDQTYIFHNFQHPRYCDCLLSPEAQQWESRPSDL